MSGSSLDGVDLAYCVFRFDDGKWKFEILECDCSPYPLNLNQSLRTAHTLDGRELVALDSRLGEYYGDIINNFIIDQSIGEIDVIASHGHTLFHFPEERWTSQIGSGSKIAAKTRIPTVCELRAMDMAYGGEGAPIVPIGDQLLFPEYRYLLNIGGICNITVKGSDKIYAYDIAPANQVLNHFAQSSGRLFDDGGALAAQGTINEKLVNELKHIDYFTRKPPKSLDNSFFETEVMPVIAANEDNTENIMASYGAFLGQIIAEQLQEAGERLLVTGGGAYNDFLIDQIRANTTNEVVIPASRIIDFKEALVMAFMGVLRLRGQANILKTVTGAGKNSCSGALHIP